MKKLMLSTAILAAMTVSAAAQDGIFRGDMTAGSVAASDLIGARIYASEAALDATEYNGIQDGWEDIGEINDVILSRDGSVESVLVDIGGFLGMGERQAAVSMTSLQFVSEAGTADDPDDWFLVINADRATIEGAPEWTMGANMDATGTAPMTDTTAMDTTTTDTTTGTTAVAPETAPATDMTADGTATTTPDATMDTTTATPMARDGYDTVVATDLTSEMLTGATAYDMNDESVGSVSDLVLTAAGDVTAAIIDVGGFLGMGAKPIEVNLDEVEILRETDGDDVRIYVSMTKEQLEAMPTYSN